MSQMSTAQFLLHLRTLNVTVSAEHDRLRVRSAGVITPDLQRELAARKTEILDFLKEASAATHEECTPIKPIPRGGALPISFAQMRLWLLDQLQPNKVAYNIPALFHLKGDLNQLVLEKSLGEIVRRHEVLRAYFLNVEGNAVQRIASWEPFKIAVVNLQSLSEYARQQKAESLVSQCASQPFDLAKAPLIRATLLKLRPDEHSLLVDIHHIAFDGWSFRVLLQELSTLYKAFLKDQTSPLPELSIQYADFAAWQQQWLQGEVLQVQLDYWKKKLAGELPVLELPTDRPRPAVQSYNGENISFAFSKRLADRLKALSQQEGVTLFVTMLAAFKTLLMRYTSQEDILVGTPIANRNHGEIEGLIGFFVNMLVMRTDFSENPSFRILLHRVQSTALDAYSHQDLPFEKLVEEVHPDRNFARSPIFQVMFAFQNMGVQALEMPGLEPSRPEFLAVGAKFDLSLSIEETDQGLTGGWSYSTDLFEEGTIRRMLSHFEVLLEGIVSNPDEQLSRLPLLTPSEREQILYEWNDTAVEFSEGKLGMGVQELFEMEAERRPEAVAVEFEGQRLSYGELEARANQLASYLRERGVGSDRLVGILMERSLEMVVALYGVLKAGGAYVPLDPSFPRERLDYMVKDSGMAVLITQGQLGQAVQSWPGTMVRVDAEREGIAQQDRGWKSAPGDLGQVAYVLYTSGSTGQPKGVEIPHSAVVNFLLSMQREPGFESSDIMLAVTTLCFDIAGLELHLPLISGGKVVIASYEDTRDPMRLLECMRGSQCTVMQATPATWRALIDGGWSGSPGLKVLCGGESLPQDLRGKLLRRCKELWNMYGPTETTIWSTLEPVKSAEGPVLIGRPIANTQTWVLDANRNLVPEGVVGELYIGGAGVARGYLGREELTEERFVASPFAKEGRLYRTGDLARWKTGGRLECLGRVDRQVKVRGYRIELEEIEAVLGQHEGVGQCVVVAREQAGGDQRLVAYFERRTATTPSVGELRGYLGQRLPEYMIPSAFVAMDKLPMTPNRKIDRKALPAGEIEGASEGYVAPRNQREEQLAQLWAHVLKLERVGIHDNFFHLGGHSLTATQLISRIRAVMGLKVPLRSVFQAPTVAAFSEYLEAIGVVLNEFSRAPAPTRADRNVTEI
jgi:amino acid adenylation domain-containing protein